MTSRSFPNHLALLWLFLCLSCLVQSSHAQHHTNFINQRRQPLLSDRIRMSMIHELAPRMASYYNSKKDDSPSKKSQTKDKRADNKLTRGTKGSSKSSSKSSSKDKDKKMKSKSESTQQTAPTLSPIFYATRAPQDGIPTFAPAVERPPSLSNETMLNDTTIADVEEESGNTTHSPYEEEEESSDDDDDEQEEEESSDDDDEEEEESSDEEEVDDDLYELEEAEDTVSKSKAKKSKGSMMMGTKKSIKSMMMSKSRSSSEDYLEKTDFPTFGPTFEQNNTIEPTSTGGGGNFTSFPTPVGDQTNATIAPTLPAGNVTVAPIAPIPNVTVPPLLPNASLPPVLVPNTTVPPIIIPPNANATGNPVVPNATVSPNATNATVLPTALARSTPIKELDWDDITTLEWTMVGAPLQGTATSGHRFGYKVVMSRDATKLAVSTGVGSPMYLYERAPHTDQWMQLTFNDAIKASDGVLTVSGDGSTLAVKTGDVVHIHRRIEQEDGSFEWVLLGSPVQRESTSPVSVQRESTSSAESSPGSQFGDVIALSYDGTTVAIGDPADNDLTGWTQVYTYDATANAWSPLGTSAWVGYSTGDHFGHSLALSQDGRTLAVCAIQVSYETGPGYCQIHRYADGAWFQLGKNIIGQADLDSFGRSVALSSDGNTLAVGADGHDMGDLVDFGRAYVFSYDPDEKLWPQVGGMIDGKYENQRLGHSIDLSTDGSMLIVGAWAQGFRLTGYAEVYKLTISTLAKVIDNKKWTQVGQVLTNDNDFDNFGCSVSMSSDGTTVAVGASNFGAAALENTGQVTVFTLSQNEESA